MLTAVTMWTLTVSSQRQLRMFAGCADSAAAARRRGLRFVLALIRLGGAECSLYDLRVDDHVAAVVQTGTDEFGLPDHDGAAEVLTRALAPYPL